MAMSGRKHINIEAPIMKISGAYVWMDRHWFPNFCDFLKDKLTLYFNTAKECTMFGLKYDREKQKEIFRTSEWS